jgi:ABC-type transport system substrate-binding protein
MGTAEPAGAYCGDQRAPDALRLCARVSGGLYGFAPGGLTVEPRLADCSPNGDTTVWTCRLRTGLAYTDGTPVDAADVLATFVAQWDPTQPLRRARPNGSFATWDALFGAALPGGG